MWQSFSFSVTILAKLRQTFLVSLQLSRDAEAIDLAMLGQRGIIGG